MWLHALLGRYWGALQAEALQEAVTAATAPHLKQHDYWQLRLALRSAQAALHRPADPQPIPKVASDDPKRDARAWFQQAGIKIVKSG
jgi:hypothetical protein